MNRIVLFLLSLLVPLFSLAQQLHVDTIGILDSKISSSSSLLFYNNHFFSANDHGRISFFSIDTINAQILDTLPIHPSVQDMEEAHIDDSALYLADIGNNEGARHNLHFLVYHRLSPLSFNIVPDTIFFSYPDQTSFTPSNMATDFDCEAFVVTDSSIFLFTKQWNTCSTAVYSIPKTPGNYQASYVGSLPVNGLVTGASYYPLANRLVLCGYTKLMMPFLYLVGNIEHSNFVSASFHKRIDLAMPFVQIEAVASSNGSDFYATSEALSYHSITNSPYLLHFNLDTFFVSSVSISQPQPSLRLSLKPNPASSALSVSGLSIGQNYSIVDARGRIIKSATAQAESFSLDISFLSTGLYGFLTPQGSISFIKK